MHARSLPAGGRFGAIRASSQSYLSVRVEPLLLNAAETLGFAGHVYTDVLLILREFGVSFGDVTKEFGYTELVILYPTTTLVNRRAPSVFIYRRLPVIRRLWVEWLRHIVMVYVRIPRVGTFGGQMRLGLSLPWWGRPS